MPPIKIPGFGPFNTGGNDPYSMNTGFKTNETKKPVKGYDKKHPVNNYDNELKLIMHIRNRLDLSRQLRDELNIRLRNIDLDLNSFVKYDDDDKKRVLENRRGYSKKPVNTALPLAIAKIDDLVTFLLEIFFPSAEGMFGAESSAPQQSIANAFAVELNKQGKMRGFYHKVARFFYEALKYNVAVLGVDWCVEKGFKITNNAAKQLEVKKDEILYEGNDLYNIDIYNFYYDPTVRYITDIPDKGEWAASVQMMTRFKIQKMAIAGELIGVENWISNDAPKTTSLYFAERPVVRFDYNANTGSVDWVKFAAGDMYQTIGWGVELITWVGWLNPSQFGLSDDNELQIWRICIGNQIHICHAQKLDNAHNLLPILVTCPLEDNLGLQRKSPAELLTDLNNFASFLMNSHIQATRKRLVGLTVYDPTKIDLTTIGDDVSGRVPVTPTAYGTDLKTILHQFNDAPETAKTVEDIKAIIDLLEYIQPTNQQKQVADLDRATTYQAAATVQGTNRRSLKAAKIIEDQAMSKVRMIMMWNTLQYKTTIKLNDEQGNPQDVSVAQFRDQGLEYDTGDGVQSLDRIMLVHLLHDVINSLLQSQEAQKQIDIVGLIGYWVKLFGTKIDIAQFKYPQQQNPQEQQQQQQQQEQQGNQADIISKLAQAHAATAPQGQQPPGQNTAPTGLPPDLMSLLKPQGQA